MLFNDGNKLQFCNWIFKVTSMEIKVIKKVIHQTFSFTFSFVGKMNTNDEWASDRGVTSYGNEFSFL